MDLITDLPPSDGYDSILVMVNQGLSKGVIVGIGCRFKVQDYQDQLEEALVE